MSRDQWRKLSWDPALKDARPWSENRLIACFPSYIIRHPFWRSTTIIKAEGFYEAIVVPLLRHPSTTLHEWRCVLKLSRSPRKEGSTDLICPILPSKEAWSRIMLCLVHSSSPFNWKQNPVHRIKTTGIRGSQPIEGFALVTGTLHHLSAAR